MSDELLGETLKGRWRLDEVLGRGGMGTVFKATELPRGRTVAVKVVHTSLVEHPDIVKRFRREASLMKGLSHPNLVPLLAVEHAADLEYFVMGYAPGTPLSVRLKERGRHPVKETLVILEQLASALDYLHGKGIIHRDVKPANVVVGDDGHVTLLDFGISRPPESALTLPGVSLGTPQFMAPEQAIGKNVDHRADLYALGLLAYSLLTGEPPFGNVDSFEAIRRHLYEPPALATEKTRAVSDAVARVLNRALAKKPEDRYGSGAELFQRLTQAYSSATMVDLGEVHAPTMEGLPTVATELPDDVGDEPSATEDEAPERTEVDDVGETRERLEPVSARPVTTRARPYIPSAGPVRAPQPRSPSEPSSAPVTTRNEVPVGLWIVAGVSAVLFVLAVVARALAS